MHRVFSRRRSGVLLHPSSLPDPGADGVLGTDAYRFLDFLCAAGFTVWQMLPVNAIDWQGSPYQAISVHAGNPRFICLQDLLRQGWLDQAVYDSRARLPLNHCLAAAYRGFTDRATREDRTRFQEFREQQGHWLEDYALYAVIKQDCEMRPWWQWPEELLHREPAALERFCSTYGEQIDVLRFEQFVFFSQWEALHQAAREKQILLFGDMPIFVAHDSVEVWAKQTCFQLDDKGQPTFVAGVPPDYFSATGQRWGNPLYNWECMAGDGYRWWLDRMRTHLHLFDLVRLDHFRGFSSYWEIPAHSQTAVEGRWVEAPGRELLGELVREFGELPLIAEDLGTISDEVLALRDEFELPGMKVLLFAFDSDARNPYLPHNHEQNSVVYTGTHDNNTSLGWFYNLDEQMQQKVLEYLLYPKDTMPWPLIQSALQSVCHTAILPLQDLLGLDGSHRMNTPGTNSGNWQWRFDWSWLSSDLIGRLRHLNEIYGR